MLQINTRDSALVVDSRLIAELLGVDYRAFHDTIHKYQSTIEKEFGILRFQTAKINDDRGRPQKTIWLTEKQATFLMTLSRNTPEVIAAKINLVNKAFEQAAPKQISPEGVPTAILAVSPFDHAKRTDVYGMEFWSSREILMMLGQCAHSRLEKYIIKAKAKFSQFSDEPITKHCILIPRPRKDYKMSGLFCLVLAHTITPNTFNLAYINAATTYFAQNYGELTPLPPKPAIEPSTPVATPTPSPVLVSELDDFKRELFYLRKELNCLREYMGQPRLAKPIE